MIRTTNNNNTGETMKKFEKLIKKYEKTTNSGWNYVWGLKNPRLTDGFWTKYGNKLEKILDELKSDEHIKDWKQYCKDNYLAWDMVVSDCMC